MISVRVFVSEKETKKKLRKAGAVYILTWMTTINPKQPATVLRGRGYNNLKRFDKN